jgi:hypothetical protein
LDELGFDWDPTGKRAAKELSWEEGFGLLVSLFKPSHSFIALVLNLSTAKSQVDFGQSNGHYNVPPPIDRHDQDGARLYRWVQSLHMEHRALQSGQESTLLDDVGVSALLNIGFRFQI